MPVTVRGGDILFNDGTTQSTAAGAVSTTAVLNATAGASLGAVGSYAFLVPISGTVGLAAGTTYAGSSLRYAGSPGTSTGSLGANSTAPAGTWRSMGFPVAGTPTVYGITSTYGAAVFLRIS
jgi:hypothetical protein